MDWNYNLRRYFPLQTRRTLYRYVDWNCFIRLPGFEIMVVPYIGTWIETDNDFVLDAAKESRTLYRYVDWNVHSRFSE